MSSLKINSTRHYAMFERSKENRLTNVGRRKRLMRSMQKYGFLPYFPIVCKRVNGKLTVLEGQHRLEIAESIGQPVYWVEASVSFDIAEINGTAEVWKLKDYAEKYAANGNIHYAEILEFKERYGLTIGVAATLLAGNSSFSNIQPSFIDGKFVVKDREWAMQVASLYSSLVAESRLLRTSRCLEACIMVCRVEGFEPSRLIHGAKRCNDKLLSFSTRDAYLAMFEEIYNFGRKQLFGLKAAAITAMRSRNAVVQSMERKAARQQKASA